MSCSFADLSDVSSAMVTAKMLSTAAQNHFLNRPQEVFLTQHHLGIAMEFVEGGDLAQYVQEHRIPGVCK